MTVTALARPTETGVALAVSMGLGACASEGPRPDAGRTSSQTAGSPSPTRNQTPGDRTDSPDAAQTGNEGTMQLDITIGDQSYFTGIVVLGRLDGDAADRIAALDGAVSATVKAR